MHWRRLSPSLAFNVLQFPGRCCCKSVTDGTAVMWRDDTKRLFGSSSFSIRVFCRSGYFLGFLNPVTGCVDWRIWQAKPRGVLVCVVLFFFLHDCLALVTEVALSKAEQTKCYLLLYLTGETWRLSSDPGIQVSGILKYYKGICFIFILFCYSFSLCKMSNYWCW